MNNGYNRRPTLRERLAAFMMGRYGRDKLYDFLLGLCIALLIINLFTESWVIAIIEISLFFFATYRFLSRNIYKRQIENQIYLKIAKKISDPFVLLKNKFRDRKTHVYKRCPYCKSTLRLPKIKGEHIVKCPKCQGRFDVRVK